MATLLENPTKTKKEFRMQKRLWHLTYKTHIPINEILELIRKPKPRLIGYSIVHELGSEKEMNEMRYEHTHVAMIYEKLIDCTDCRKWDIGKIHPHISPKMGMKWMENLFESYHRGHKKTKDGKKLFVPPIRLEQELPESFEFNRERLLAIKNAESLLEACMVGEIQPRSVSDVKILRASKRRRLCKAKYTLDDFAWEPLKNLATHAQVLVGASNIGKTQFALAHFDRALVVSSMDELKKFEEGFHDGIIFDDMEFFEFKRTTQIHLTDLEMDRSIRVRHSDAFIPAGTPRIFTGNYLERVLRLDDPAIARRCNVHPLVLLEKDAAGRVAAIRDN